MTKAKKKKQQSRTGLITQWFYEETCVASAVSIIRKALGYETGLPLKLKMVIDGKTEIAWLLENCGKLFPDHLVECLGGPVEGSRNYHNLRTSEEWHMDKGRRYLQFFSYTTFSQVGRNLTGGRGIETHTVVGFPVVYDGMSVSYIVRVALPEEKK